MQRIHPETQINNSLSKSPPPLINHISNKQCGSLPYTCLHNWTKTLAQNHTKNLSLAKWKRLANKFGKTNLTLYNFALSQDQKWRKLRERFPNKFRCWQSDDSWDNNKNCKFQKPSSAEQCDLSTNHKRDFYWPSEQSSQAHTISPRTQPQENVRGTTQCTKEWTVVKIH